MRQAILGVCVWLAAGWAWADEPAAPAPDARTAIERGLAFLAKDSLAWKEAHNCASCHHAGMVVWAMREAKLRGYAVDEPVLAEMTQWMATAGDGKITTQRPASAPRAMSTKALYFALALTIDPQPDASSQEGLKHFLQTIESEQIEDGSWSGWPETRPPLFGNSHDALTALATLALLPAAASGDEPAKVARDKAVAWLTSTKTDDDPQSIAARLILWRRLDRPADEWEPLVQRIRERQNADGGWSQTPEMASDAWATGQALYGLAHADVKPDDPTIERGRGFLVATQRADGSWPMTSRPLKPDGGGAKNLIPITGAGSAWALLGLVRSR
jgi:squalene cyclase